MPGESAETCNVCGRLVVDASTDFGIGLTLRPGCYGIAVEVTDYSGPHPATRTLGFVTRDELQGFLDRAYGKAVR